MDSVLIQGKLGKGELEQLRREFPQFIFLSMSELTYKTLGREEWSRIVIIYGNRLTAHELKLAEHLKWIHSPSPELNKLCLKELENRESIIITSSEEENKVQIAEFIFSGVLAYAKNLFHWEAVDKNPALLWDSKWRDQMISLENRTFIQIGLSNVGKEIAKKAKNMGMKVIGFDDKPTFNPYCHQIFHTRKLHFHLPEADVISVALPKGRQKDKLLKRTELELMKQDSILSIVGSSLIVDEIALHKLATGGKFRGILVDANYLVPIPPSSLLWDIPNIIITPEVAPRPRSENVVSLGNFRYNMRQFLHQNFSDMRNVLY